MDITLAIAIIGCAIGISTFVLNRKDKSNSNTEKESYKSGVIETKLDYLGKQVEKILQLLDNYDIEIDEKIAKAIEVHEKEWHKKEK